jgi:hypothetical protein
MNHNNEKKGKKNLFQKCKKLVNNKTEKIHKNNNSKNEISKKNI